ncbi:hypothetical protein EKO04_008457 [Ascochyta lentis]|uniref:BTB domain-containing protein n=1 Tax=Ascochyta lentis TaxID=205686 RepID=A0A8H7MFZ7_9PLEO|nr:hypothetical protein EKO04_008457 [Ascochyta lentis]
MVDSEEQAVKSELPAFGSSLGDEIVTVVVGTEQKNYRLHKALLVHHSEYFCNALKAPWKEAEDGVVPLTDVDVEVFDLFARWIYTQKIPYKIYGPMWDHQGNGRNYSLTEISWLYLKAFVFGDRFLAQIFRSAAQQEFSHLSKTYGRFMTEINDAAIIQYAFENVPAQHPLLQQIADNYRHQMCYWEDRRNRYGMSKLTKQCYEPFSISAQRSLPIDFLLRVNKGIHQYGLDLSRQDERSREHCYFEHASDKEKKKCGKLHVEYDEHMGYGFWNP